MHNDRRFELASLAYAFAKTECGESLRYARCFEAIFAAFDLFFEHLTVFEQLIGCVRAESVESISKRRDETSSYSFALQLRV